MAAAAFRSALTGGSNVLPSALPSIFDILAQQSLTTSLKPALQHVVKVNNDVSYVASVSLRNFLATSESKPIVVLFYSKDFKDAKC